ncbi:MAG: GNAT family N-acetyltransferase [Proteobacteria bacterium]|uniref:GNAT family N-acetyltransferase n=1 Tax=Candidatus Enterousia avistercoris TaxID=2840788 RepID=A0A9D9DH89_9PROT|nr:GNAT family N-acetyltransferase [Candidatus Enterousia avistercoris]
MEYPRIIQNADITLKKIDPSFDNARKLFDIVSSERDFLREFLSWVDDVKRPEDMYIHMYKVSKTDNASYYIIYDGQIVGNIGIDISSKKNKIAEIAYWLSRKYNGHGIMTRAVKILEQFAFENMDVNRIEIVMDVDNVKSESVAKRAGYMCEGVRRQSYMFRNELRDVFTYSKLKSEWEKENKNA